MATALLGPTSTTTMPGLHSFGWGKTARPKSIDVSNMPALFLRHPGWHAIFDADPEQAEKVRRSTMDRAIAENAMIAGYHYPFPAAGMVSKDGDGYAFVPVV